MGSRNGNQKRFQPAQHGLRAEAHQVCQHLPMEPRRHLHAPLGSPLFLLFFRLFVKAEFGSTLAHVTLIVRLKQLAGLTHNYRLLIMGPTRLLHVRLDSLIFQPRTYQHVGMEFGTTPVRAMLIVRLNRLMGAALN